MEITQLVRYHQKNVRMKKVNAYMYPISSRGKSSVYNPYIDNFLSHTFFFINYLNKDKPSDKGFLDILKYLTKIDILFLNWIENVPDRKGGLIQFLLVFLVLRVKKIFGFKIVWTLHNKISHSPKRIYFKKYLFKELIKRSDLVITHSKEGISFAESILSGTSSKVFYFPHPILEFRGSDKLQSHENIKYDILIWGTMAPYKGIHNFLKRFKQEKELSELRILIAGKAPSTDYFNILKAFENDKIKIQNQFLSNEELFILIKKSKAVLFTYSNDSVLSSGVLMDSLAYGAFIIGPNVGAFKDVSEDYNIIITYNDFDQLFNHLEIIDEIKKTIIYSSIKEFVNQNSWANFSIELRKRLEYNIILPSN